MSERESERDACLRVRIFGGHNVRILFLARHPQVTKNMLCNISLCKGSLPLPRLCAAEMIGACPSGVVNQELHVTFVSAMLRLKTRNAIYLPRSYLVGEGCAGWAVTRDETDYQHCLRYAVGIGGLKILFRVYSDGVGGLDHWYKGCLRSWTKTVHIFFSVPPPGRHFCCIDDVVCRRAEASAAWQATQSCSLGSGIKIRPEAKVAPAQPRSGGCMGD